MRPQLTRWPPGRPGNRDIVVSGSNDETLMVWDAITGAPVGDPMDMTGSPFMDKGMVRAAAAGRVGGSDILVAASYRMVQVWDAVTGVRASYLDTSHDGWFTATVVGRAGDRDVIVAGTDDGSLLIWDAVTGDPVGDLLAHEPGEVITLAIGRVASRDLIAAANVHGSLQIWTPPSPAARSTIPRTAKTR